MKKNIRYIVGLMIVILGNQHVSANPEEESKNSQEPSAKEVSPAGNPAPNNQPKVNHAQPLISIQEEKHGGLKLVPPSKEGFKIVDDGKGQLLIVAAHKPTLELLPITGGGKGLMKLKTTGSGMQLVADPNSNMRIITDSKGGVKIVAADKGGLMISNDGKGGLKIVDDGKSGLKIVNNGKGHKEVSAKTIEIGKKLFPSLANSDLNSAPESFKSDIDLVSWSEAGGGRVKFKAKWQNKDYELCYTERSFTSGRMSRQLTFWRPDGKGGWIKVVDTGIVMDAWLHMSTDVNGVSISVSHKPWMFIPNSLLCEGKGKVEIKAKLEELKKR